MEKSFTQRMDWLHTWFGLVLGWLAFALFLTGTIAVFWFEIQHWAQPELHGAKMLPLEDTVQYSVDYLEKVAPDSRRWAVTLPDLDRHPLLVLNWLDENDAQQFVRLVPDGSGAEVTTVTQGGRFFVDFHWTFNRPVHDLTGGTFQWTYMLSGAVGLAFLICTITGLVVHKKIFRNFFTFRRQAKSVQTRWLDAHNVLGVISWPFQFMIVLTGLAFYCYLYIPSGMQMASRYPEPPRAAVVGGGGPSMLWGRFTADAVGRVPGNIVAPGNPAPNVPDRGSLRTGAGRDGYRLELHGEQSPPRQRHGAIRRHARAHARNHLHVRQHGVRWRHRRRDQPRGQHDQRRAEGHERSRRHPFRVLRRHRDAGALFPLRPGGHDHDRRRPRDVHGEAPREGAVRRGGAFLRLRRSHERRRHRRRRCSPVRATSGRCGCCRSRSRILQGAFPASACTRRSAPCRSIRPRARTSSCTRSGWRGALPGRMRCYARRTKRGSSSSRRSPRSASGCPSSAISCRTATSSR